MECAGDGKARCLAFRTSAGAGGPHDSTVELVCRDTTPRELQLWWILPAHPDRDNGISRGGSLASSLTASMSTISSDSEASSASSAGSFAGSAHSLLSSASSRGMPAGSNLFYICAVNRRGKHYLSRHGRAPGPKIGLWWRPETNDLQVTAALPCPALPRPADLPGT